MTKRQLETALDVLGWLSEQPGTERSLLDAIGEIRSLLWDLAEAK